MMTHRVKRVRLMARIIKRYGNRKLYDSEGRRYVSLQEIGEFVREGQEVIVVDNASGNDLTAPTLAKIIAEESGANKPASDLLHEVVRWGGTVLKAGVGQVEGALDRAVEASLQRLTSVQQLRAESEHIRAQLSRLEQALAAAQERKTRKARRSTQLPVRASDNNSYH